MDRNDYDFRVNAQTSFAGGSTTQVGRMGLRNTVTNGVSQIWWGVNTSVFYTYTPPTNAAFRQYLILKGLDNNAPSMLLNFLCE